MQASEPYIYEGEFINENNQKIKFYQLRVDITVGDTTIPLTRSLKGLEKEYIKLYMKQEK